MTWTGLLSLIPGPTTVPLSVREAYLIDFGSGDLEPAFFDLYRANCSLLQEFLHTTDQIVILSGEGMVALWGALKSTVKTGDRVLAISSGIFGDGFEQMAAACGAETRLLKGPPGDTPSLDQIRDAILSFRPTLVTVVHVETPSAIQNDISAIGSIVHEVGGLLLVDFVASAGGCPLEVSAWGIDLGLLGSQKVLSIIPDLSVVSVSEAAWKVIEQVNYRGYDALKGFRNALEIGEFPYTPNWHSHEALNRSLKLLKEEGFENVVKRHEKVAAFTRAKVRELGLKLYPVRDEIAASTVTGIWMPDGWEWPKLNAALRAKGLALGGSYEYLSGKIFRIGHMGTQAQIPLVEKALAILKEVLDARPQKQ
jgi:aspartate aminotransferase-like enzyme